MRSSCRKPTPAVRDGESATKTQRAVGENILEAARETNWWSVEAPVERPEMDVPPEMVVPREYLKND